MGVLYAGWPCLRILCVIRPVLSSVNCKLMKFYY